MQFCGNKHRNETTHLLTILTDCGPMAVSFVNSDGFSLKTVPACVCVYVCVLGGGGGGGGAFCVPPLMTTGPLYGTGRSAGWAADTWTVATAGSIVHRPAAGSEAPALPAGQPAHGVCTAAKRYADQIILAEPADTSQGRNFAPLQRKGNCFALLNTTNSPLVCMCNENLYGSPRSDAQQL